MNHTVQGITVQYIFEKVETVEEQADEAELQGDRMQRASESQ